MKTLAGWWMCVIVLASVCAGAPKQHVVVFGKWTSVKLLAGDDESALVDMKLYSSMDARKSSRPEQDWAFGI